MRDFEVNYRAGYRISLGETLYRTEDGHYQFKYSPFSAMLYLPLSYLPLSMAKVIWYYLIIFSVAAVVVLSRRLVGLKQRSFLLILLALLILAKFFLRELQLGQINAFITMILLAMVWSLRTEEDTGQKMSWSGLLWAFSTALKPYALIFFFYFLIKKKWKSLISGALFLAFSLFIPSLFYGWKGNIKVLQEWMSTLSQSTPRLLDSQDNISIAALFMKWSGSQYVSLFLWLAVTAGLAVFVYFLVKKGKDMEKAPVLDSALLLIFIPLLSPLGWDYTLLMSFLGVLLILHHFFDYPRLWRGLLVFNLFLIAFSLYDLLGKELYARFMSWSVITINFLILMGYLAYLRCKRIC